MDKQQTPEDSAEGANKSQLKVSINFQELFFFSILYAAALQSKTFSIYWP